MNRKARKTEQNQSNPPCKRLLSIYYSRCTMAEPVKGRFQSYKALKNFLPIFDPLKAFCQSIRDSINVSMSETSTKPCLLIVDDEAEVRGVLHDLLSGPYQCGEAASAEEALAKLRENDYQLVISDITMSG